MKHLIVLATALALTTGAYAVGYNSDFEADAPGTLPVGWYVFTPWGDFAPGPVTASVQAAPGGGQALMVEWGTDWASYGASSGEAGYTLDMTGLDPEDSILSVSYDFYKENYRVWQVFGDQSYFPPGGIHMNDDPAKPNEMAIGTEDYANAALHLYDVPENMWVHVESMFDSATDAWTTTVSYPTGSGGGTFNGTSTNAIAGEYWFGGWAFQVTMDAAPAVPYDNALYIDNFAFEVVPEPSLLALLGLGAIAVLGRRR